MTTEFTPLAGLIGGILIGLSAIVLMLGSGRTAGNSGILVGAADVALAPAGLTGRRCAQQLLDIRLEHPVADVAE